MPTALWPIALAIAVVLAGCHTPEAKGDYPAVNTNDCLPNIALLDRHDAPVSLASLKGKPVLIDFIYASCPSICPLLTAKMAQVAQVLGPELGTKARIVTITIDPEHDTPAVLAKYAVAHGADKKGWLFLTGTPAQIDRVLARFDLRRQREKDGTIDHVAEAFLLGSDGHQLRQYQALEVNAKAVAADIDRASGRG